MTRKAGLPKTISAEFSSPGKGSPARNFDALALTGFVEKRKQEGATREQVKNEVRWNLWQR
jgi:hypothetical protein